MYTYTICKCDRGSPSTAWRFACGQPVALTVSVEGVLINYVSKYFSVCCICVLLSRLFFIGECSCAGSVTGHLAFDSAL